MSFNIDKMISPFIKALPPSGLAKFLEITANNPNIVPLSVGEPDFDILNKIADIFQVDADYLLGRSSLSHEPEPVTIAAHLDTSDLTQLSWMMLKNTFNLSVQKENNKGAFRNGYAEQI